MVSAWLRRNAVIVVLAALAAGIATWAFTRRPAAEGPQALSRVRGRLAACLLGQPVSRSGPDIARLRALQLAGARDWPQRCAPYAVAVEEALPHHAGDVHNAASQAIAQGKLFQFYDVNHDVSELLTAPHDEPIASLAEVASDVPSPPTAVLLPREVAEVSLNAASTADAGGADLSLLIGDELACRFAARGGGLEPVAHCSYPPDEQVFATKGSSQAATVAGTQYVWPADPTRSSVMRRNASGTTTTLRLPHKLDESATLVGSQLLWTEHDRVVGVSLEGATVGAVYEVAKGVHLPREDLCATDEAAGTLLVDGDDRYRIAAYTKGGWHVSELGPRYQLSCDGATVTGLVTTSRADGIGIYRVDCSAAGCTSTEGGLEHIVGPNAVAAIGSDTIVVWADDLVRGVRGPLTSLATAKPFPILDGARYEKLDDKQVSASAMIHDVAVYGRGASAIVVLHSDHLLLVHVRDGKPERIAVDYD